MVKRQASRSSTTWLAMVDVTGTKRYFQAFLVSLLWYLSVKIAIKEFVEHRDLGKAMVLHPEDMSWPKYLGHQQHDLDAGDLYLFKDFNISDLVAPVKIKHGPQVWFNIRWYKKRKTIRRVQLTNFTMSITLFHNRNPSKSPFFANWIGNYFPFKFVNFIYWPSG